MSSSSLSYAGLLEASGPSFHARHLNRRGDRSENFSEMLGDYETPAI